MQGVDDRIAKRIGEVLEQYQFALTIAEHERDCYARAAITELERRQCSKPVANAVFKKEHGNIMAIEAKKIAEKAAKVQKKEEQEILRAQYKAIVADQRLQKAIQKDIAKDASSKPVAPSKIK
ncbi:uncharacterized protein PV09_09682 [Verruconis gallopava]|uniref:Uncharacterized protein n=1 Tax=Verruconis gallopava TaxID=253628 RepID=A0A0D1ZVQ9_9PEZI|nr:uncharacterized protein PV09_09682 [Verruconis gallopava]KIV98517.1 hypothetical protein PV09_09682 [Verruconis gallopava]